MPHADMFDAEELARRITAALDVSGADVNRIAAELNITRQAVNGWKKTGRVKKAYLPVLARYTGQSVDYFLGSAEMTAQEKKEVELVQAFRALPPAFQQKLMQDAIQYATLTKQQPQDK